MSYNYLTQYNSPNYTPAAQAKATWGRARTVEAIAIHWWGDPATNPSFEGVVATLVNPARGASAHYVATGTGRRVACLVSPADASWATNSANPYTISIECDPRCRPEDYDVVAELIADIRSAYGDLPLIGHRDVVATRCPGDWDLGRLNALARTKFSHATEWGQGGDIRPKVTREEIAAAYLEILERPVDDGGMNTYLNAGFDLNRVKQELRNSQEYRDLLARKEAEANQPKPEEPKPTEPETPVEPEQPTEPETPEEPPVKEDPKPGEPTTPVETPDDKVSWLYKVLTKVWEAILAYLSKNINRVK